MGKYNWRAIVFFLLVFILAIGLSYVAFNENSVERADKEKEQVMSIALVNEDEGAIFNGERIVFGDEFANGINRNSEHDWYVVSRGVAESGYNRGAYDMVIIIPNNFSEKSLSIHLENPEPVSLQYKINATGHENVRAEAEKTAGNILNEFNRRLIDVYFASIIGTLQEAQDNISEIIDQEKEYAGLYHQQIYTPLADYTNQFQTVQDYTEISKESYRGLQDVLENFQVQLSEEVDQHQSFLTEVDSVIRIKEEESVMTKTFSDFFDRFIQRMNDGDVLAQLAILERENEYVQQQFLQSEDNDRTIAMRASLIENHLEQLVKDIQQFRNDLEKKLHIELENVVKDNLRADFDETIEPTVEKLFTTLDRNILSDIEAQINELPSLNPKDIYESGLEGETLRDILNVIHVTKKFNKEFDNEPNIRNRSNLLSEKIKEMKNKLAYEGIVVEDEIELPSYDGEEQFLNISISDEFRLGEIKLTFSNGKTVTYWNRNSIELESPPAGPLSIQLHVRLKDPNIDIDVFEPVEWTWEVSQEGMEEVVDEQPAPPNDDGNGEDGGNGNGKNDQSEDNKDAQGDNGGNGNEENEQDIDENEENNREDLESINDGQEQTTEDEEENGNGNDDGEDETPPEIPEEPEQPEPNPPIKSETIVRTNNYFTQKVLSSLIANPKDELVEAVSNMVNEYYQLHSLYELYFGLDMSDEELIEKVSGKLRDAASETSLYYFIYEKEIKDILEDYLLNDVKDHITSDIQRMMKVLEENIASYVRFVESTSDESIRLVETIAHTKKHAEILNEQLAGMLDELAKWRVTSHELLDEKSIVLEHDQEVNRAMFELNTSFQPLLAASESLLEQARGNFDIANNVYDTFDAIDQQAINIQESGTNIVDHATDLADKLTEKTLEDDNFKENFNEVLSNSRVGDRPNENLYRFLANPVQTKNTGIITEGESFTAYFMTIILSIITLFTAYVLSTLNLRRKEDVFEAEQSIINSNKTIALTTALIGVIEGIVVGLLSFYLLPLPFESMYTWLAMIVLSTAVMLFFATYLLRQLKMIGMFILLTIFSAYLFLTRSLGFRFENNALVETLRHISPLQHVEAELANMIESGINPSFFTWSVLIILAVLAFVLNVFVFQKSELEEEMEDENQAEAN